MTHCLRHLLPIGLTESFSLCYVTLLCYFCHAIVIASIISICSSCLPMSYVYLLRVTKTFSCP
jgi:hypothetical protein